MHFQGTEHGEKFTPAHLLWLHLLHRSDLYKYTEAKASFSADTAVAKNCLANGNDPNDDQPLLDR